MTLFNSVLQDEAKRHPLLILQSSLAQSSLPILRSLIVDSSKNSGRNVLFCLLYPPSIFVESSSLDFVDIHDWLDKVPGYGDFDKHKELLTITKIVLQETSRVVRIIIDSIDTLASDKGSLTETYACLSDVYALVRQHPHARLILHTQSPSAFIPLIASTAFSSSLTHVIAHPPCLLHYLSAELNTPPPPLSPFPKFWSVFIPVSERIHDTERLVFGAAGEGSGHPSELVIEVIAREGGGRKRGTERVLEGWSNATNKGSCELSALESLKDLMKKPQEQVSALDPTQNLPFNLTLTSSQQESRAQVPLPYAHGGKAAAPGAIYYDPDSADDIDDDDPDEDLDI